jgi:uncharacterized membrane protein YphA (DoxX/SURF4 family)
MNLGNRKLLITVRTLLGLMFLLSGIAGFMTASSMEGIPPAMVPYMQALVGSGIFYMIKVTEVVAGLMLVTGFLPALAALSLVPLCVGILIFNGLLSPQNLWSGLVVSILTAYLGYAYWDKYRAIFQR